MKTAKYFLLEALPLAIPLLLISRALYLIFMVVPNERTMGPVQRIFFFHVPSAMACYSSILLIFICGLLYLRRRSTTTDVISEAAAEVGWLFCTIVLLTGMIWAKSAWNTWFNWEPRLVSFVVLWLILMSMNLLRSFADPARAAQHAAVLGIVSAVMVPVVVFSIRLLPQTAQLHPAVERDGLADASFRQAFATAAFGMTALQLYLVWLRSRLGFLKALSKSR